MNPRGILGLQPWAGPEEVRHAHARLTAALSSHRGTSELRRLVDRAFDAALRGRALNGPPPQPRMLLGVEPDASLAQVQGAYRRLARVVHPDSGGTAELFHLVADARKSLTGQRPVRVGPSPPPPRSRPRRPVPYVAPPLEARARRRPGRAWKDVAIYMGLLVGLGLVAGGVFTLSGRAVLPFIPFALLWLALLFRPAVGSLARAVVVLRGSRVRVPPAVEPERFLTERCLDAPMERERHDLLYAEYRAWCRRRGVTGVAPPIFVERLRALGLSYVKVSAWDQGLWVGIRLARK